ncbi:PREDICTED: uncharacterized protein LOC109229996 [Nicotiana attenuata]|uniref:uncharacterized protein LOC109229996 n=1 Tax=Nicotiana attenuata TaxID=49451 RepID=UPI000904F269|nr:PREDICTED: uncharacterized protein LOC109229996 [Nicotiana attenuata]
MEDCGLVDLDFYGPKVTWSNGRGECSIVWKRLERGLANDHRLEAFPAATISHLASTGSDHNPYSWNFIQDKTVIKSTSNPSTNKDVRGNAMWVFHQKRKALSHALSLWSRQQYGDIFRKAKEFEQKVKDAKMIWAQTNNDTDRATLNELKAQYVKHLKVEQEVLKQKTQLK